MKIWIIGFTYSSGEDGETLAAVKSDYVAKAWLKRLKEKGTRRLYATYFIEPREISDISSLKKEVEE